METIVLSVIATYGLTTVVIDSTGPFGVFDRLRKVSWLGALECFLCLSIYTGAVISLFSATGVLDFILRTLAYSAGAIIIYKIMEALDG